METPVAGEYKQLFQKRTAYKAWVTRARDKLYQVLKDENITSVIEL